MKIIQQNSIEWKNSLGDLLTQIELVVDQPKPELRNIGFNCFHGMPSLKFDGSLLDIPDKQGYVKIVYADNQTALLWTSNVRCDGQYYFS